MKITGTLLLAAAFSSALVSGAPLKYGNPGWEAPTYTFTATTTGDEIGYFYGSTAGFTDYMGLWVNGRQAGSFSLDDHTSTFGQWVDFGHVNAGDTLVFALDVVTLTPGRQYVVTSDPAMNADGKNHTYTTAFGGETRNGVTIAAGTFVAFEDLLWPRSDGNYNDEDVVFSNVTATVGDPPAGVPEPTSLALLGLGLAGGTVGLFRKRRA